MTVEEVSHKEKVPVHKRYQLAGGAIWSFGGFGSGTLLRLLSNIILTRLLFQEAFGIMALTTVLISGIVILSDIGIYTSLVQNPKAENRKFLDTAWTLAIIRGFILFAIMCAASIPFANYYETPELRYLVPLVALRIPIESFATTKVVMFRRHVKVKQITLIDVSTQVSGLIVMIPLAWYFEAVWTLAASSIVPGVLRTTISYLLPGRNNRLCWDPDSARQIYHFGRWILISSAMSFADHSSDRLIFGKLVTMGTLGVYSIGAMMAAVGARAITRLSNTLIFPLLSRVNQENERVGPQFLRIRKPVVVLSAWGTTILIAAGAPLMHTLYDPRYAAAGWMVQFLAVGSWFRIIEQMNQVTLLALGDSQWVAGQNGVKLIGMAILIPIGWTFWDFPGAVAAISGAQLFRYLFSLLGTRRHKIYSFSQDLRYTAQIAAASAGGLLLASWLQSLSLDSSFVFVAVAAAVTIVWSPELIPSALQVKSRLKSEKI